MEYPSEECFYHKLIEEPFVQMAIGISTLVLVCYIIYRIYKRCSKCVRNNRDSAWDMNGDCCIRIHVRKNTTLLRATLLESNEPNDSPGNREDLQNKNINSPIMTDIRDNANETTLLETNESNQRINESVEAMKDLDNKKCKRLWSKELLHFNQNFRLLKNNSGNPATEEV